MPTTESPQGAEQPAKTPAEAEREAARVRVNARRDFSSHVVAYVVINATLVVIWALSGFGYFWPGWVIGPWGAGLLLHAWDVFLRRPVTEEDVDRELQRLHR